MRNDGIEQEPALHAREWSIDADAHGLVSNARRKGGSSVPPKALYSDTRMCSDEEPVRSGPVTSFVDLGQRDLAVYVADVVHEEVVDQVLVGEQHPLERIGLSPGVSRSGFCLALYRNT